jgi:hypothetical protein
LIAKQQYPFLDDGINQDRFGGLLFIRLTKPEYCKIKSNKKGINDGSMGSKSKHRIMKSSQNIQKESGTKKNKKEITPDIISKSFLKESYSMLNRSINPLNHNKMETRANEIRAGLNKFYGSQIIFKHPMFNTQYTEGIQYLAEQAKCYWLIIDASIVASTLTDQCNFISIDVHRFFGEDAIKNNCAAIVTYSDGNGNQLYIQKYSATDFHLEHIQLFFVVDTLLLPTEY